MKTQTKTTKPEIKLPTISMTHVDDEIVAFQTSTWKTMQVWYI